MKLLELTQDEVTFYYYFGYQYQIILFYVDYGFD